MDMDVKSPDAGFITPSFYTILYWIGNAVIVAGGFMFAKATIEVTRRASYGYERAASTDNAGLILGTIAGTLLALIFWRVAYELVIVFFEQLRTTRQVRDKLQASLKINGLGVEALESLSAAVVELKAQIRKLDEDVVAMKTVSNKKHADGAENGGTTRCPLCGAEISGLEGVQPGQHVRCPYCQGKFSYQCV